MKVKLRLAKEITPLLRAAVKSQIECWVFLRQIERKIGVDFRNMERAVGDLAAAGDPETIDDQEAQAFIENLEVDR